MHASCVSSLADIKRQYPNSFTRKRVLELGSHDVGLKMRSFFTDSEYIGVDEFKSYGYRHSQEEAKQYGVDLFVNARETNFDKDSFDVLICLSMFEHDPLWLESLSHNLPYIKKGGLVILEWGAEGNGQHDSHWEPVTTTDFFKKIKKLPLTILDSYFEGIKFPPEDCPGGFTVIAKKI